MIPLVKNANRTAVNAAPTSINPMPTIFALSGALCSVMSPYPTVSTVVQTK